MGYAMILTFDEPQKLTEHFDVPIDSTSWDKHYEGDSNITPKRGNPHFTLNEALQPSSNLTLPNSGLFLLALEIPHKAIFIGFSERNLVHRLCRYRTVITATNVGHVHNVTKWRTFAENRFNEFQKQNKKPDCSDVSFMIG